MKNFGKTTDIRDIITVGYEADNAVLYSTSQSLTNDQKIQARANIGAGTSNFDGDYDSLTHKPTIPTKTSQLNNDSNFATTSQVEAKYTKPPEGIPKTDLATAVQNSLTAADSAVKYTRQSLTDAQKDQARKNIGAGTSNFSGNYKDLADKPDIPAAVSIVQSTGESTSSVMSQKATTNAVNGRLSKTDNTNVEVLGTKKATTTLGGNQLYAPNGVIFGGTAAAAGLVTRGICGVSTPSDGGACSKENLYINYDGNNDFNAGRQVVLNAGTVGNHLGSNMYQYTVPRGEIVKNWVEAKGYATTSQVNEKQNAITASNKLSASLVSGLATVATSGSYNDLENKPTNYVTTNTEQTITSKKTFNGEVKFGSTENFQGYYIKRMIGSLGPGTAYNSLDSKYKDGTYHRMWRLRFPSGSSFWGKIKITLYGGYSSFNASGVMSKSITCNFNTSNIYNNVGCYDGLGVNVEQDFRISEAIWNATVSAWEVLIWQKNLSGNNSPTIMLECWTTNNTNYIKAFNGITVQTVELTQSTSYSAQRASSTGGTKTVEWATLPVYENPLGEEIATMSDLPNSVKSVIDYNDASKNIKIGYQGAGISGDSIKYIAGYTAGDSESVARIKDIDKASMKNWLGYATVATSGSYDDLLNKPTFVSSVNGSSGAITNVAKTDETNVFTKSQIIQRSSDETQASLWSYGGCIAYSHWVQGSSSEPRIGIGYKNSGIRVFNGTTETPLQYYDVTIPSQAGQLVTDTFAKFTGETSGIANPYRVFPNEEVYAAYKSTSPGTPLDFKYTSQTYSTFIANTDANSRSAFTDGRIVNKKNGTNYELTLPTKTGTLALTSDIPTVNNGTLTIQKNGTKVQTFTANQSSSVTANITVPTKTSELTNDSGFLTSHQDISGKANLSGGNTFTGKQTLTSPPADGYSIDASGYIKGSWLQAPSTGHVESGTGKVCVLSENGWIYYRTPKEVIIDAECAVKYELKKTINFGQDGVLYVGKFKVYDTNVTCEITSTTSVTYSGKLVIATQNYVISQMTVYGDAANTVAPNFFIKPSTTSDPYIEVYFKPMSWSKNVVHIYGSNIEAEPTDVCTNEPSIPSTATLKPKNALPIYSLSGTTLTITL